MDNGELGRKLLEIRTARGLTQREVARSSPDLTATAISRIERGERYPNLQTLEVLGRALRFELIVDPHGTRVRML